MAATASSWRATVRNTGKRASVISRAASGTVVSMSRIVRWRPGDVSRAQNSMIPTEYSHSSQGSSSRR